MPVFLWNLFKISISEQNLLYPVLRSVRLKVILLVHCNHSTISDIRLQKNNSVKLKTLYEIADGLELGLNDFFDSPLFERENLMD